MSNISIFEHINTFKTNMISNEGKESAMFSFKSQSINKKCETSCTDLPKSNGSQKKLSIKWNPRAQDYQVKRGLLDPKSEIYYKNRKSAPVDFSQQSQLKNENVSSTPLSDQPNFGHQSVQQKTQIGQIKQIDFFSGTTFEDESQDTSQIDSFSDMAQNDITLIPNEFWAENGDLPCENERESPAVLTLKKEESKVKSYPKLDFET